jgi:hypothetical protein
MKYKEGDKVRIKDIDWYNENKNEDGTVEFEFHIFVPGMSKFCGKVLTVADVYTNFYGCETYSMKEDDYEWGWGVDTIEGLVEETKHEFKTEQEIFERLKEALGYDYLTTEFDDEEATNLDDYLRNIKIGRGMDEEFDDYTSTQMKTYQEFIHYLSDRAIGNTDGIIVAFDNNMYNEFKGYVKANKVIKDNDLYLEFEVDGSKLTAIWQPGDNYGVWQQCGYCGDDYSGYLLFPTYDKNEYFCLKYSC